MAYGSQSSVPDTPRRIAVRLVPPSRVRHGYRRPATPRVLLPVIGVDDIILPSFDEKLGAFAILAQEDDRDARDALYFAFLPKLTRLMANVRPPAAPPGAEGIWSREDVEQEAYLVFLELIGAWSGDVSFTSFLLSRFPWRLKDVMLRGIGKPSVPPRWVEVPIEVADLAPGERDVVSDAGTILDAVLAGLPEPLDTALIAHIMEGKSKTMVAREMGISRRTMVRYWQDIRAHATMVLGAVFPPEP